MSTILQQVDVSKFDLRSVATIVQAYAHKEVRFLHLCRLSLCAGGFVLHASLLAYAQDKNVRGLCAESVTRECGRGVT